MNASTNDLTFHEIRSINDPRYDDWLDLYQTSFPLPEQVLVSELNRMLRAAEAGADQSAHFLAVADGAGDMVAMGLYQNEISCGAAMLWYMAVVPRGRGQGIGACVYREIRRRALDGTGARALFLEVEDPEECDGEEARALAARRIAFYQRLGVQRLCGITYTQSVGWQPPLSMHLMVDLWEEQPSVAVLDVARCVFGDNLAVIGPATLL